MTPLTIGWRMDIKLPLIIICYFNELIKMCSNWFDYYRSLEE